MQGDRSKLDEGENTIISEVNNCLKTGYQGWAVHKGTTKVPLEPSSLIFFKILVIKAKDGNAYQKSCFHDMVKAFIAIALGSPF